MLELENKIREAIPKLKQLTEGAIVYRPHWNSFEQKFQEGVFDEIEYRFGKFFYCNEELEHFQLDSSWYIGHKIQLNDVLEYITQKDCYAAISINNHFYFTNGYKHYFWDLSSVFLADQNDELKRFLNDL